MARLPSAVREAEINPGRDQIVLARLTLPELIDAADPMSAVLSADEAERRLSFHAEDDRNRFTVTRAAVRLMLGAILKEDPGAMEFATGPHGKPMLAMASGAPLEFNVSKSPDVALVALCRRPIGVDIELVTSSIPYLGMARRFFSRDELASFASLPEYAQVDRFFDIWTRKEAYVKALGFGLSLPPEQITVGLTNGGRVKDETNRTDVTWVTHALAISPHTAAAVSVEEGDWDLRLADATNLVNEILDRTVRYH